MGIVYSRRGENDLAIECYERQMRICEELGNRRGISIAIGNIGIECYSRGEYDRAIECYERKMSICEELGDRSGISNTIGNMAIVYQVLGEYDRAIECYEGQMCIDKELGDRNGVALAIGNIGSACLSLGEHERALENFHRAAEEHRAIGSRFGLTHWLLGIGQLLVELVQAGEALPEYLSQFVPDMTVETQHAASLRYARTCVEESIAISDNISKPDTQFDGRVMLALIEAAEGNEDVAVQCLIGMLADTASDAQRAEIHYRLSNLGESGHAAQAQALYEALYAVIPNHEYHTRIDELKAAGKAS
jgi:tetratricopeptide (TPR) repeat protein